MMSSQSIASQILAGSIFFVAFAGTARADLIVVEQNGTDYKIQQRLSDDSSLKVPPGARVKFKRLPDGVYVIVDGPYDGSLANYRVKGGCPWWNNACKSEKTPTPGGTRGPATTKVISGDESAYCDVAPPCPKGCEKDPMRNSCIEVGH